MSASLTEEQTTLLITNLENIFETILAAAAQEADESDVTDIEEALGEVKTKLSDLASKMTTLQEEAMIRRGFTIVGEPLPEEQLIQVRLSYPAAKTVTCECGKCVTESCHICEGDEAINDENLDMD